MKKKKLIVTLSSISIIILIGIILFKINKEEDLLYLTEKVKRSNIVQNVTATGSIRSNNRVEVGAQVSGKIIQLNVKLGQVLRKGDLIAKIDSLTQENNLEKAKSFLSSYKSQLESKKIELEINQSQYDRAKKLFSLKSISQEEYENSKQKYFLSKSELKEIQEQIKQAEIDVKTAETELSYTTITSPIDGVVISIPISEGQTVNSAQTTPTIVQVADLTKMLIKPEISEGDITKLKVGQDVEFTILSAPNKVFKGKINSIDPADTTLTDDEYEESVSNTEAIYYYANVIVDNENDILKIGMTTTVTIKIAEALDCLTIPTLAIENRNGKNYVKVLEDQNKVIEKEIMLGINDDFNTQIVSGVSEGETIILNEIKDTEQISTLPPRF